MGNLIYLTVTILMNSWIIGYLGYKAGNFIHVLLLIAIVVIVATVIQERIRTERSKVIAPKHAV